MVLSVGVGGSGNLLSDHSLRLSYLSLRTLHLDEVSVDYGKLLSQQSWLFFLRLSAQTSVQENSSLPSLVLTTVALTKATTLLRLSTFALLTG